MGRMRDEHHLLLAGELVVRFFVQLDDAGIFAADDQQRRRFHARESAAGEIRTSAARDDGADAIRNARGRDERRAAASARAEISDALLRAEPLRRADETLREKLD